MTKAPPTATSPPNFPEEAKLVVRVVPATAAALLSKKGARELSGLSRTQMWRLERLNIYPKPRMIPGTTQLVYLREELILWMENLPVAPPTTRRRRVKNANP